MTEYFNKVKQIIVSKSGLEPEEIHKNSFFEDDLNISQMELTEIIEEIEETFQIDIMDNKDEIESVQDLLDILSDRLE